MEVLSELRKLVVTDGLEPDQAVAQLLPRLKAADLRAIVAPLLEWEATKIARSVTRGIERRVASSPQPCSSRSELVGRMIWLPDGRTVEWLLATAEDHRLRAEWLRGQAVALMETAKLHDDAARDIDAAGVSCLADLEGRGEESAA